MTDLLYIPGFLRRTEPNTGPKTLGAARKTKWVTPKPKAKTVSVETKAANIDLREQLVKLGYRRSVVEGLKITRVGEVIDAIRNGEGAPREDAL
tara:strand:+ start:38 stop:319 length:282 start_codon:yes stop_codon:yes gene_type:complete